MIFKKMKKKQGQTDIKEGIFLCYGFKVGFLYVIR